MTAPQAAPCMLQAWQFAEAELRGFLLHQLHDADAADDLLHEVFLKAMRQGGRFCQIDNARAWLFQVARNALVDMQRAMRWSICSAPRARLIRCPTICPPLLMIRPPSRHWPTVFRSRWRACRPTIATPSSSASSGGCLRLNTPSCAG
ncbi:hypothetical protein THICB1_180001 [Thiomonas arsenitoxydans]|uniref:RNA polymerase sigma-70 region 2 domain-containing protein n=1 Tax=Thiomonas arsenitoxydans (strain DSM 22701 / CIP 110005 / 3As) TaxID=426114 RepID=A0ABP1Z3N2_THIA3|nr:hypothetical protein THICB1_180001 [Thiomonas arsenitoxydans]